ncbi:uncharacterized protein LOC111437165 [Cucurbita moschata]|uniref:Uncharacterized protein LOC111437165 n=1 Tax=Cucurbita moschata TaxID=3662 RepID=A0A6J1ESH7_CUCMO|nr:uncharacterized protein LOC111437165 [Cucurbita moschata]
MASCLDSFLHYTTPVAQSQFLLKPEIKKLNRFWHALEREKIEYFTLSNLWNCYAEWSAYGAKVPITLSDGESLNQYYVPYLSGIQIFTSFRLKTESGNGETGDSCSDCHCEAGSTSSDDEARLGYLYFEFIEKSTPYVRLPLLDKINELSRRFPGLMTLRSVDLSPASWMSVSWYPIYHIPMGRNIKDLNTCFLTYHILSSSFQDKKMEEECSRMTRQRTREPGEGIPLAPFGVVTYKMQGSLWMAGNDGRDQERLMSLSSMAESWLKQSKVQHHDFNFFTSMRRG